MLRFFQSGYLSRYFFIIGLAFIFWIPSGITSADYAGDQLPLYRAVLWLTGNIYFIYLALAFTLTLFTALIINHISAENGITERVSTLSAFLYILIASSQSYITVMSPFIWVNLFIVILMWLLYSIPFTSNQLTLAFNSGFLVGMAVLFYTPMVFLVLVIWIAFLIHSANAWRNYAVSAIGVSIPVTYIFIWYFWFDRLPEFYENWKNLFSIPNLQAFLSLSLLDLFIIVILVIAIVISVFKVSASLREKSINIRRNLIVTVYFFIVILSIVILQDNPNSSLMLAMPGTLILSNLLNSTIKTKIFNSILVVMVILILVDQYLKLTISF